MNASSVTVLICTYNRAAFLRDTLRAIVKLERRSDYRLDVLVVDNNSSDDTRRVVHEAAEHSPIPIAYEFESRQGKSFALNTGLRLTDSDIIAHTDDDVWPDPGWTDRIVDAFRHDDLSFAFGKVRPRWDVVPPPHLLTKRAHEIWGPLAILDYGDEPTLYLADTPGLRLPVGANLAFARDILLTVGGWRTDLGKVNNTLISGEDHEIFDRLRRFGLFRGLYDPGISVRHFVPASRLTRRYFRRWFFWHGRTLAHMPQAIHELDLSRVPHVAGVPRFLYRQALEQLWRWVRTMGRRDALATLIQELQAIEYAGYCVQCWQWWLRGQRAPVTPSAPVAPIGANANGA
jgi:glycosyltransferase involved in cell wall biosynthesis